MSDFLSPGKYVKFASTDPLAKTARKIVDTSEDRRDAITAIYDFATCVVYDHEKADALLGDNGYVPDPEATFESFRGVCLDKAALMVAMLRASGIRAKLVVGTLDGESHAWVSAELDVGKWARCDPTWANVWDAEEMARHEYVVTQEL